MRDHERHPETTFGGLATRLDRRALVRAGATGAAGLGLAALLGGRSPARAAAAQDATCPGDEVRLTYGFWNAEQRPAIEQQIELFRESHPNISVDPQVVPFADYWTKLQTGIAGGESYDVFWMNGPNVRVYAARGALLDVGPITGAGGVDLAAYPQQLVNLYTVDGTLYGVARDFDTIGLFFNKELFDRAEVAYPTPEWTWQDLRAAAEKLTVKEGDTTTQWGFCATLSDQQTLFNFIVQNGGQILSPDGTQALVGEPAACEAMLYLADMFAAGLTPSVADQQANNPYDTLFPGGRIAMIPGGSWQVRKFREANPAIDVAPLPMGKQRGTMIHGLANAVWTGSRHPCEALEFAKFLASREAEEILANTGTVIPAMNGLQEAWKAASPGMNLQVFLDAVAYAVPFPSSPNGPEWQAALQEVTVGAWSGEIPRDQVCARAAEATNDALQGS